VADNKAKVSGVAERYARALFELAVDDNLEAVENDLGRFSDLIDSSADLRRLVNSPAFSADQQFRAISVVLERAGIGGMAGNLIKLATRNRRLFAVPGMVVAFGQMAASHRGEIAAVVTSAEPLSDSHIKDLKEALKASLGKDVTLETSVDPDIIGGLIVKVGSRMIDGSIRTKLNSLKLSMKEVG